MKGLKIIIPTIISTFFYRASGELCAGLCGIDHLRHCKIISEKVGCSCQVCVEKYWWADILDWFTNISGGLIHPGYFIMLMGYFILLLLILLLMYRKFKKTKKEKASISEG